MDFFLAVLLSESRFLTMNCISSYLGVKHRISVISSRKYQIASENNRKRMLQRCLTGWQLWCHTQREQGAILAQQQEMQRKMAALINVVSVSKIEASDTPNLKPLKAPTGAANHWETTEAVR